MTLKQSNQTHKENRKVKSSVFTDLFYEDITAEENMISLYNALHDEPLPPGTVIRKLRVEQVLYMNFQNDLSFGISDKALIIAEHQSTINHNMPIREFMYSGRLFEQIVTPDYRYRRTEIKLPAPEFYTFYNGKEHWAKEQLFCLSDSFMGQPDIRYLQNKKPPLELQVRLININPSAGHELLEQCPILKEYGLFIDTVRKYQGQGHESPYEQAIRECIRKGILSEYLQRKGTEVVSMLIGEYDYETDIRVQREEAHEEGRMEGHIEGRMEGISIGEARGEIRGRSQGLASSLRRILQTLGLIPNVLDQQIQSQQDPSILDDWIELALQSLSIEDFQKAISK